MSRGQYLSLEEARRMRKIKQFAKEHNSAADNRFAPLLTAMCKGEGLRRRPKDDQTSDPDASAC